MTTPYTEAEVNAAIAATIAELQQKLDAAEKRVAGLEKLLRMARDYITVECGLSRVIDKVLEQCKFK